MKLYCKLILKYNIALGHLGNMLCVKTIFEN